MVTQWLKLEETFTLLVVNILTDPITKKYGSLHVSPVPAAGQH